MAPRPEPGWHYDADALRRPVQPDNPLQVSAPALDEAMGRGL
ncbi:hypothetical protein [Pedococcus sp. 5OH_020]|nr:hypothetical protein [Pedococcus sp. 5OH_020]